MKITDRMRFSLELRRLRRALAVSIYPAFERRSGASDDEFQRGLDVGISVVGLIREREDWIPVLRMGGLSPAWYQCEMDEAEAILVSINTGRTA